MTGKGKKLDLLVEGGRRCEGGRLKGIKFRFYGKNAFREPADPGIPGFGSGFKDETLRPGKASVVHGRC